MRVYVTRVLDSIFPPFLVSLLPKLASPWPQPRQPERAFSCLSADFLGHSLLISGPDQASSSLTSFGFLRAFLGEARPQIREVCTKSILPLPFSSSPPFWKSTLPISRFLPGIEAYFSTPLPSHALSPAVNFLVLEAVWPVLPDSWGPGAPKESRTVLSVGATFPIPTQFPRSLSIQELLLLFCLSFF